MTHLQIESDTSEVYGDGFRNAAAVIAALGLEIVLEHVSRTGHLPIF